MTGFYICLTHQNSLSVLLFDLTKVVCIPKTSMFSNVKLRIIAYRPVRRSKLLPANNMITLDGKDAESTNPILIFIPHQYSFFVRHISPSHPKPRC